MTTPMPLEALVAEISTRLAEEDLVVADDRVTEVPSKRTLRYYATLGLLDPPADYQAGQAFYGERHVLQVLAIKRLQAMGFSLAQIQQRLTGAPTDVLRQTAKGPATVEGGSGQPEAPINGVAQSPVGARREFWTDVPTRRGDSQPLDVIEPAYVAAVDLGAGATLLLPAGRVPDRIDRAGLEHAAAPLLTFLGVLGAEKSTKTDDDGGAGVDPNQEDQQ